MAELFGIQDSLDEVVAQTKNLDPVHACKRLFVQRQAVKKYADPSSFNGAALRAELEEMMGEALTEASSPPMSKPGTRRPQGMAGHGDALCRLGDADGGRARVSGRHAVPHACTKPTTRSSSVPVKTVERDGVTMLRLPEHDWRERDGFALTDAGMNDRQALEPDRLLHLLPRPRQGLVLARACATTRRARSRRTRSASRSTAARSTRRSARCTDARDGDALGALALVCIDNPMLPGTGHRICNDCMKACVFQKQEPVNIPQIETRVLTEVLGLPWGFEIYRFLTRWNPLDVARPHAAAVQRARTCSSSASAPPATRSRTTSRARASAWSAIDGLKLEPLPVELTGDDARRAASVHDFDALRGARRAHPPRVRRRERVRHHRSLGQELSDAPLHLARAQRATAHVRRRPLRRDASTLDDAWELGFDHVAHRGGRGPPDLIDIKNNLARGIRKASDFLMALQLTGAYKRSIANLQIRLPAVVIGGGLTAIDTATELLAYYSVQIEKVAARYATLVAERARSACAPPATTRSGGNRRAVSRACEGARRRAKQAAAEGRAPYFAQLLDSWGGVTLAYRRKLVESPSYTLNHEEVAKAWRKACASRKGCLPPPSRSDRFGHAAGLRCKKPDGTEIVLPARAVLVAAGTQPNTVFAREDHRIKLDGKYFQAVEETGNPVTPARSLCKPDVDRVLGRLAPMTAASSAFSATCIRAFSAMS